MISANISNSTNGIITNINHTIANNIDMEINERPVNAVIFIQFITLNAFGAGNNYWKYFGVVSHCKTPEMYEFYKHFHLISVGE